MKSSTWLVGVVVFGTSLAALARPGADNPGEEGRGWGPRGPGGPGMGLCLALKAPEVGLTDEQAAQLKPLCKTQREKMTSLRESLGELHDAVRDELEKDVPDLDRVGTLHQQMATLQTEMVRQHVALRAEARKVLSPSQLEKLKALRDEHGGPHGRHGAGHGGGPGGCEGPGAGPGGDAFGGPDRDVD